MSATATPYPEGTRVLFHTAKARHSALLRHRAGTVGVALCTGADGYVRVRFGGEDSRACFWVAPECLRYADAMEEVLAQPCSWCLSERCSTPAECSVAYSRWRADVEVLEADSAMAEAAYDEYRYAQGER